MLMLDSVIFAHHLEFCSPFSTISVSMNLGTPYLQMMLSSKNLDAVLALGLATAFASHHLE